MRSDRRPRRTASRRSSSSPTRPGRGSRRRRRPTPDRAADVRPSPPRPRPLKDRVGAAGEAAALDFLSSRGLRILERDWRCRLGQVDIVADDGGTLVVVEVKTRRGTRFGLPEEAVDPRKRRRLRMLVDAYRAATGRWEQQCRIDVLGLLVDDRLQVVRCEHIAGAVGGD